MNMDKRLLRQALLARWWLAGTVGMGLLGGLLLVGQAAALTAAIDGLFWGGRTLAEITPLLLLLLTLTALRAATLWASEVAAHRVAGAVKHALRQQLLAHLLRLGPAYLAGERSGELVTTLTEGIEALEDYFGQYLPRLWLAALIPLAILCFVLPIDLLSALVLLLTAPLILLFMVLIGKAAGAVSRRQWRVLSLMSAHFLDVLQGLTTLKLFGRSKAQYAIIQRIGDDFRQATMGVLRVAFLSALALELLATISTAIVAVEIGLRLLHGGIVFAQAFFVLVLAPEFYLPLRQLGASFHAGTAGITAAGRIFEVLETPPPKPDPQERAALPADLRLDIRFDDVHYSYTGGERAALRGLNLRIHAGERVALVGPSGAGKSTVVQLLLRFIEPDAGMITVGGVPLRQLPAVAWRELIGWVPQTPYLFHATVADNIRFGRPEATLDAVMQAAQQAHAHDFITRLPQGYHTVIGERGARLSGGQGQLVALARAFLKDAPLLVLDEATSNLDPGHEALVKEAARLLMRGRTVLIIAHRLGTVYEADRIVVLDAGQVAESGTHESLLAQGGLYRRLVAAYGGSA